MLSGQVQYQGKAGFLKLNFQFSNSQNTGKCELGQFLLRQSHLGITFVEIDSVACSVLTTAS